MWFEQSLNYADSLFNLGGIVQRSKSESSLGDILLEGDSTNKTGLLYIV